MKNPPHSRNANLPARCLMQWTAICALLLAVAPAAFAANKTWNAASGSWNYTSANWSPSAFASGDDAIFSAATGDSAITMNLTNVTARSISSAGANTPATMTINGVAGDVLTLGTGVAGTGNITDSSTTTGSYLQSLTYNLSATGAGFSLAAGSGTAGTPTIWNMASGKTFSVVGNNNASQFIDLNANTVNLTGAGTIFLQLQNANAILKSTGGTGTFNVNSGTLSLQGGSSAAPTFDNSITVNVAAGATLQLRPNSSAANAKYLMTVNLNGGTYLGDSGSPTISGPVNLLASSTISRLAGATTTIASVISGSANLSVTGTGTLLLTGTNTYTGNTTNNSGPLTISDAGSLGGGNYAGNLVNNATFTYNSSKAQTLSGVISGTGQLIKTNSSSTLTLTGVNTYTNDTTVSGGTLVIGGAGQLNSGSYAGNVTNNATFTYFSSAAQNLSGVISGTGVLNKSGGSTLTLSGANTYTGPTVVNNGILEITGGSLDNTAISVNNNATLAIQPGSATTINLGSATEAAAAGATLNLGTNTFDMTDGAISTCNLQQEGTFAGPALMMTSGARLKFNLGDSGSDLLAVSMAASVSGTINVALDTSTATSWTGTPTFTVLTAASGLDSGTWVLANSTATVGGVFYKFTITSTATAVTITATPAYTVTYDGNGSDGGTIPADANSPYLTGSTVTVIGAGNLTKTGLAFNGWNTAADGSGTAYVAGNTFTSLANTTLYAQWVTPAATITIPSVLPGGLSAVYGSPSSPQSVSVSGSGLTANMVAHAPAGLEVSSDGTTYGSTATFVQGGGSVSGTLYVRLVAGDLVSGSFNSLSVYLTTSGAATVNTATTSSGNTVAAKALTVASATAQDKLHDGNTSATVTGNLQSAEAFGAGSSGDGKPYTGDVLMVGCTGSTFANSAAGNWSVTAGTFTLGGAAAGNYTLTQPTGLSLTASILSAGVWTNAAALANWSDAVNWTNGIIATNTGNTADFSQADITSDVTVNLTTPMTIGNLIFGNTDVSPANSWTLANNSTLENVLTLAASTMPTITVTNLGAGRADITAAVAGTGGLTKAGDGNLTLSGVNTYTGDTTISLGTLRIGDAGQLGSGAYTGNITNNGALDCGISAVQTLSGVISGAGSLTNSGSGTLTLSGNNTYTGGTTVSGGVLIVTTGSALGTGLVDLNGGDRLVINDGLTVTNDIIFDTGAINGGAQGRGMLENSGPGNATLSGGTITINSALAGGGNFASTGGGTLTVADPINSPSATVIWRTGTGIFSGGGSYVNLSITGTLKVGANNGLAQNATVLLGASGAATLDLAGFNQSLAGMTLGTGGTATITNSSTTTPSTLTTTDNGTYSGAINDAGGVGTVALTVSGGQLTLSGTNNYTGNTTLAGGILTVAAPESAGSKGPLGTGGAILFSGGTLQYSAANTYDYSPRFSTASGQAYSIDTDGQTVTLATGLTSSGGTLTVADATYSSGILILSGASTYSGATTVNAGKLYVNGSLNAAGAVSVIGGSATFGGRGSVGAVTVSSGGNVEGGQGGAGVLTMTSLAFSDYGTVMATPNVTIAPLKVTASNGLNPSGGAGTVTINLGGGVLTAGTYHLIQYSGSIQGSGFSAFQLGITPGGSFAYALVNNAGFVDLQVTALADVWTGDFSSEWSLNTIASPKNWTVTGTGPIDFADGQDVLFDDSATSTTVTISATDVAPNSFIFNNSTKDYTLQGTHAITGGIGLQKYGAGTVTINNTNSFTGDVTINAGTVAVSDMENGGSSSPLGAGYNINLGGAKLKYTGTGSSSGRPVNLSANGTIEVTAAPATLTLGSVNSTAVLTKTGSGTLEFSGDCAYTGNAAINAGTLMVDGALGDGSYNYAGNITNNGSFVFGGAYLVGNGVISGTGSVGVTLPGGQLTLNGVNTYTGDTTISGSTLLIGGTGQLGAGAYAGNIINNGIMNYSSSAAQSLSGAISGTGSLTKAGTETLVLSGTNSYTGGTTISAGTITAQNDQGAANGGWMIGVDNINVCTVNFAAGSTIAVANGYQIVLGNGINGGSTSLESLNVGGTVTNSGLLSVGRESVVNLNAGAIWNQIGDLVLSIGGGYGATLNVNSNAFLTYLGADPITVSGGTTGPSVLNIDGTGTLITGAGFVQINTPTTGYGRVTLSNGGTIRLLADVSDLTTQVQFSLGSGGGVIDNNGHNAALSGVTTVGAIANGIFGAGSLTKKGLGTLTLTGTNTYTGDTIISAGTLVLATNSPINSSPNIVVAGGATLDVSTIAFGLRSNQTLSNSTATAILNGNVTITNTSSGMSLTYASGTPSFTIGNGVLTISSNTVFKLNNTGAALAAGSYKVVSKGAGGSVVGTTLPASVTVGGNGLAAGMGASLQLTSDELYLVVVQSVNTSSPVLTNSVSGGTLTLSWPADHLGWHLQNQTNALTGGLGTNWVDVPGSDTVTSTNIPINPANPAVFYRLVYP